MVDDTGRIAARLLQLGLVADDSTHDQVVGGGSPNDTGLGISVFADPGAGNDSLSGFMAISDGNAEVDGPTPARIIAFGGDGNDSPHGGTRNDQLHGDAGNDALVGEGGNDRLFGGLGNDTLTGGAGGDRLVGGKDFGLWLPSNRVFRVGDVLDVTDGEAVRDQMFCSRGDGVDLMRGFGRGEDQGLLSGISAAQIAQVQLQAAWC